MNLIASCDARIFVRAVARVRVLKNSSSGLVVRKIHSPIRYILLRSSSFVKHSGRTDSFIYSRDLWLKIFSLPFVLSNFVFEIVSKHESIKMANRLEMAVRLETRRRHQQLRHLLSFYVLYEPSVLFAQP